MSVFWGGTFVAGRVIAQEVEPFSAAFLRFVIASLFLVFFATRSSTGLPRLKKNQIFPAILLGMTGVFAYNVLFFSGLKTVTASRSALIIATNPALIAVLSSVFFNEKLNVSKIIGIVSCVFGAAVVISRGKLTEILNSSLGWGEIFLLGCVLSWVAYSLVGKVIMKELAPVAAVTYSCVIGAIALFFPAYLEGVTHSFDNYSTVAWWCILYLGFFGSALGFWWYYDGIKTIGPARAAVFINLVPVSAVLLGWLILNERIDLSLIVGTFMVTCGVYLTNKGTRKTRQS
jgi:drug/metabolite transporter (DMT)-like permease